MERYRNYGHRRSILMFAIIGIIIFIFVYFPFFATNLRYAIGSLFRKIFDTIGILFLATGFLYISVAIFEIFSHGHNWPKKFLIGTILLYMGSWLTGLTYDWINGGFVEKVTRGYH